MIVAKMALQSLVERVWRREPRSAQHVAEFHSQYDANLPEDRRFCKATPTANASFTIDNTPVIEQLEPGKAYFFVIMNEDEYRAFSEAPKPRDNDEGETQG